MLDNTARILVGLVVTPFLTRWLGRDLYGAWTMINQINGYVALGNFRVSSTVKYFLSLNQHSDDVQFKRRIVGAALRLVTWSLPLMLVAVGGVAVMAPSIFHTEPALVLQIRWGLLITGLTLVVVQYASVPNNVLRGLNMDYKAIGLKSGALILSSVASLVFVALGWQLAGLALGNLVGVCALGAVHLWLVFRYVEWFGTAKPRPDEVKSYTASSIWITLGSAGGLLLTGSDYVLIGWLFSPAEAATYSLTAALARFSFSPLASLTSASNAGIAGLCGAGDWERVARLKDEFRLLTLLATGVVGAAVLYVNAPFVARWVGPVFFGGTGLTAVLLFQGVCTSLSQADSNVLDGLGAVREKAIIMTLSGIGALTAAVLLAMRFGMMGVAIGVLAGRLAGGIYFYRRIGQHAALKRRFSAASLRLPGAILAAWTLACFAPKPGAEWLNLVGGAALAGVVALAILWLAGLGAEQRATVTARVGQQFTRFRARAGKN